MTFERVLVQGGLLSLLKQIHKWIFILIGHVSHSLILRVGPIINTCDMPEPSMELENVFGHNLRDPVRSLPRPKICNAFLTYIFTRLPAASLDGGPPAA